MTTYSTPPAVLAQAITRAASKYLTHVVSNGAELLTGIWHIESGSSYPNDYVNSEGYGGLFGTTNWNGSPQSQANTAASILANLINKNGGNVSAALSEYSGGAYTTVPGATTTSAAAAQTSTTAYQRPRPGTPPATEQYASLESWGEGILKDLSPVPLGNPKSTLEQSWEGILGTVTDVKDLVKLAVFLTNPKTWLRVFEAMVGLTIMVGSLIGLALLLLRGEAKASVPGGKIVSKAVPELGLLSGASSRSGSRRRRKGDAAASRGEEVTRTDPPRKVTAADRLRRSRNSAKRKQTVRKQRRDRDRRYGGIPF